MPCLAGFCNRNTPLPAPQIEVLPLGIQQFALPASHQQEQGHDVLELRVVAVLEHARQTPGLFGGQVTFPCIVGFEQRYASGRVMLGSGYAPLLGQVEHVA